MDLEKLVRLPVLSVRQPWASYILSGMKRIELRTWLTDYRGWLWIHTGKRPDLEALEIMGLSVHDFRMGGLLGIAHLSSCRLIQSPTEWHALRNEHRSPGRFVEGVYAWLFSDAVALSGRIECRGELHLFRLDAAARKRVGDHLLASPLHNEFVEMARRLPNPPVQSIEMP